MSPLRVRKLSPWVEYTELVVLFFLHAMATATWFVPMSSVLNAHGLGHLVPYAFATTSIAAFVSPLIFGAMADRHVSPVKVLRWLVFATAVMMTVCTHSIQQRWNPWLVLPLIQVLALCFTPTMSITTAIVFSRLRNSQNEFGSVRAGATFGWMCGCWIVSALNADASVRSGYLDALMWLGLFGFTFLLPSVDPPKSTELLTLKQRMGWDALTLLKNHDHRVVFITVALFYIPLSVFYPFTPPHMLDLGLKHTSAWMTLGQTTEAFAMFGLAGLLSRWRIKWILTAGLCFGVLRFALCAVNSKWSVLAGVAMHGPSLVLMLITAQIYVNERVDSAWRARAQALMSLITSGAGSLLGFLSTGWWFEACKGPAGMRWTLFWSVIAASVGVVLVYFLIAYHGKGVSPRNQSLR